MGAANLSPSVERQTGFRRRPPPAPLRLLGPQTGPTSIWARKRPRPFLAQPGPGFQKPLPGAFFF